VGLSAAFLAEDGTIARRPDQSDLVGRLNEERAVRALSRPSWAPPGWFRGVRRATRYEDCVCKKDVIIISCDRGQLGVQIKSSVRSARRFMQRKCPHDVVCVVLLDCDTFDVICTKIIGALKELRAKRATMRYRVSLQRISPVRGRRLS